jgi:SAM-dependent methyltransferase
VKATFRRWARRAPAPAVDFAKRVRGSRRLRRLVHPVWWGNLRRLEPLSPRWGSERGTVVDRHYIDRFFAENAAAIHGRVLEVRDPRYTNEFGGDVSSIDVVDIDPRNDDATIVADLADAGSLPTGAFDCAIVPQTLVYVRDPVTALENLWQSLAPDGSLLLTTPAIAHLDPDTPELDRWHVTPAGLEELIARACPGGTAIVRGFGNPVVAIAFLHGIAAEELRSSELEADHARFPIVVTASVRKEDACPPAAP